MDQNQTSQALECKVCQKVTMADGTTVWVCKECGAENQPGEAKVIVDVEPNLQAEISSAAAQITPASEQPK
jgi:ribosomal protein L37AE/L43A